MSSKGDSHPNLRNRKKHQQQEQPTNFDERESLLLDTTTKSEKEDDDGNDNKTTTTIRSEQNSNSQQTDGYILIPLRERSIIGRLDVGLFLILYGILFGLDYYSNVGNQHHNQWIESFTLVAFPMVLIVHLGLFLLQQWSVVWRATVGYQRMKSTLDTSKLWTHCLVEAPHVDKHHSSHDAAIIEVKRQKYNSRNDDTVVIVNFQDIIFRCKCSKDDSDGEDADSKLWSTTLKSAQTKDNKTTTSKVFGFHRLRYPIHFPLTFYKKWCGYENMEDMLSAQQTYGTNTTNIELPPFIELLQEQVVAPFFLFQLFCVLLWCLDEYWYYAVFTFFALLMFESTMAYNRLKSLQRLRSYTVHSQKLLLAYRPAYPPGKNGWVQISVAEMVPGDIVSCKQITLVPSPGTQRDQRQESIMAQKQQQLNRVPADILLLNGDAVVDESLLTGESIPQLKVALEADGASKDASVSENELDLQEHKQFILFGGTTLVVSHSGNESISTIPNPPDQGAVGMVLRTGFETAQGSLLRTMAHTQKSVDGIHTRDTYVFILILLCCAVASAAMVWEEGWKDNTRNKFRLCLHVIIIVTSVVPPGKRLHFEASNMIDCSKK